MTLTAPMNEFILHWGEMGTRWGVNRTVAQVHALLYLSPDPLTAEEIADTLTVARSNVSTSLRELQNWKLVDVVSRMGDRRDFFHTSHDVWTLFLIVIEQRVEREIVPTLTILRRLSADSRTDRSTPKEVSGRIAAMLDFLGDMHTWYSQIRTLPPSTLRALMRIGTGITRFLPARTRKAS